MRKTSSIRLLLVFLLSFWLSDAAALAQAGRGTVTGRIVDASGAAVPDAAIVAVALDSGATTRTQSNELGLYGLLNLPVGIYTVTVTRGGFSPVEHAGISVGVQSAVTLDVALELGGIDDTITVTADAPPLQTRDGLVGMALTNAVVTKLPLTITGGRSIENFAYAIVPGVEGNNWAANIVGGAPFSKEVLLDGTSATIQIQGHINESSPPMEAVEQFRVQTSGMPAEYGRTGGGLFNFSLRSGGNAFHGSAYGQLRHETLNANTWMNTYLEEEKPRDRQALWGTSAGGPIVANRTFYFASFERYGQTRRQLGAYDRTVPTPAFLDGDFSALLDTSVQLGTDAAGGAIYRGAILDPRTGLVFPGNVIPSARISPVSRQIADIYRRSYQPGVAGRISSNAAAPAAIDPEFTQHQFSVKGDHTLTQNARLSGSFIWTSRPRTLVDQGGIWDPDDAMGGPLAKSRTHAVTTAQARIGHSQVLSPSLLHAGTATFSRFRNPSTTGSAGGDWPGELGLDVPDAFGSFPQIAFGDAVNGIDETDIGYGVSNFYVADVFQYNDSLTWVKGRHLVKAGGDARLFQMNSHGDRAYLDYRFSAAQTGVQSGPLANQVGFGFASFMLGEVERASQAVPTDLYGRRNHLALFVQDDYRVNSALTLNVGLRWETTGAWREKYGRWANFDTEALNPVTGVRGVLEYADTSPDPFEGSRDYRQFAPRVGAAWRLGESSVVRGAYGVFYAPIGTNFWGGVPYNFSPGSFGSNMISPTGDGTAAFNWDDDAYPGALTPPSRNPAYTQWGLVSINPDSLKAGRIQQWNAGIDRALPREIVVGATYIGNRGTRLQSGDFERNQPDPAAMRGLLLSGREWNWVADEASAAAAGVSFPYAGFAGPAWMAITPYPQAAAGYGPLLFVGSPLGQSDYHALQLTASRRTVRGVSGTVSYTLSRQRGNIETSFQERWTPGSIQDITRLDDEATVIGANDRTHVAKGYVAWSFRSWTVSALFRYESGLPLAPRSSNGYAGWMYPIYVNRNPGVPLAGSFDAEHFNAADPSDPANRYFNPAAFSNPAYGDLGTGPGRIAELRGFGGAYEDLGIVKDFHIGRYTAQVKLEILNVFNRRYFADPEMNIGSPYFGQVIGPGPQAPRQGQLGLRFEW